MKQRGDPLAELQWGAVSVNVVGGLGRGPSLLSVMVLPAGFRAVPTSLLLCQPVLCRATEAGTAQGPPHCVLNSPQSPGLSTGAQALSPAVSRETKEGHWALGDGGAHG